MMAGTIDHTMPSRSAADTSSASVPGEQFPIRRRAYQRIKALFDLNGVKFAVPKVQVAEARRCRGCRTLQSAAYINHAGHCAKLINR
jgi:hypothetical protein